VNGCIQTILSTGGEGVSFRGLEVSVVEFAERKVNFRKSRMSGLERGSLSEYGSVDCKGKKP